MASHRHVRDAEALQPVAQRQQLDGHRGELGTQLCALALPVGHVSAGRHLRLVHVERRTALIDAFHQIPPLRFDSKAAAQGEPSRSKILLGVLVATVRGSVGSRAPLLADSRYQERNGLVMGDAGSLAHFIRRG